MLSIQRFDARHENFKNDFTRFLGTHSEHQSDVTDKVSEILEQVREQGDAALVKLTKQYDRIVVKHARELEINSTGLQQALDSLDPDRRAALEQAHRRVRDYAEHQRLQSWEYEDEYGSLLGQRVTALERVGIYVPGGTAAYPSSVLMNAVPAKVAGVSEIIMVAPAPDGAIQPMVLAAAAIAGVDRMFTIGGAQAVAALAYGTQTIPAVDKIVGPGNIYVATAKRMVFGKVGIDMIAGPSEVLVICDESANPDWLAMDLFSQAEHDVLARTTLISTSADILNEVEMSMNRLLPTLERADIIRQAVNSYGCFIEVESLEQAAVISNRVAPEHLELAVEDPHTLLKHIAHAGAVFMGHHTPEVFGDYCAGPNHVLPTNATARFSSPLGVYDFQKRMTILNCSHEGAAALSNVASQLAHSEGLTAHARSAELRNRPVKK